MRDEGTGTSLNGDIVAISAFTWFGGGSVI